MRINELDFKTVPDAAVIVCIGRRKSGKTVNIIDIFYQKRHNFKYGLIFCGSKATIKQYEEHFPSSFIYFGYHPKVVAKAIAKQEMDVELGKVKPMFILVDDCMWDKKGVLSDPNIRRLFMNGRHSHIFFVLSIQWCFDLVPALRQQIDFTFLSREKNKENRNRLFLNYNPCFNTPEQFDSCMVQCTQDYETFVLSNAGDTQSDKPEDNAFWYKSKHVEGGRKFRVNQTGTWWRYHRKRFNPTHYLGATETINKGKGMTITKHRSNGKRVNPNTQTNQQYPKQPNVKPGWISRGFTKVPSASHTPQASTWIENQRIQNIGPRRGGFTSCKPRYKQLDDNVRYSK
jgi:hypothetical protein